MSLTHEGVALEPVDYLATYTVAELAGRGIPVAASDAGDAEVRINKIAMRNYRSTGFSPFTTTTMLSADVVGPTDTHRVGAFLMRGKVPVWSFDEIIEPTLNQPLELLVQELAAKINMHLYSQKNYGNEDLDNISQRLPCKVLREQILQLQLNFLMDL